jgi:uncharacterized protein YeaO (DUF488 family)
MGRDDGMRVGRVYDARTDEDEMRVLVDRLWPRGLTKARADLDVWCKQVAPSAQLRAWYAHDPTRFQEFSRRYRAELASGAQREALAALLALPRDGRSITLLTATKDVSGSEAAVLAELINGGI